MYSIPLGSPTCLQKRPYVHARGDPSAWHCMFIAGSVYQGGYGRVYRGGYTGWVIRGHPAARVHYREGPDTSEAGPVGPCRGPEWVGIWSRPRGPVSARPAPGPPTPAPLGLPGPASLSRGFPTGKRRDLTSFLINLVKTAKCRQNMSKRPPIVPISKTLSKSHLLNFPDFHYSQPSLTRNYWAILTHGPDFTVKMMKCRQLYTHMYTRRVAQIPPRTRSKLLLGPLLI